VDDRAPRALTASEFTTHIPGTTRHTTHAAPTSSIRTRPDRTSTRSTFPFLTQPTQCDSNLLTAFPPCQRANPKSNVYHKSYILETLIFSSRTDMLSS
jgi:hypothetical protein